MSGDSDWIIRHGNGAAKRTVVHTPQLLSRYRGIIAYLIVIVRYGIVTICHIVEDITIRLERIAQQLVELSESAISVNIIDEYDNANVSRANSESNL